MDRVNIPASLPHAWRPFMTGRCFDFALALQKLLPGSRLVAFGSARWPDHVAVQIGHGEKAQLIDVRGPLPIEQMLAGMSGADRALQAGPIPVSVDDVALHVGHTAKSLRLGADVRALAAQRLREFRNQLLPLSPYGLDDPRAPASSAITPYQHECERSGARATSSEIGPGTRMGKLKR